MKILFFINGLQSGGKERRLVELIKSLSCFSEMKMELVLTQKNVVYTEIFSTGIKIHYIIRKNIKKDPRGFFKFYKIANNFRPDVIHVWGQMEALYTLPTKILLNIAMLNSQITNSMPFFSNSFLNQKLIFPLSNKIVANSYAGLIAHNAPAKKSSVIYNGFSFERLNNLENKISMKKKFNITSKYVVGMVADYTNNKDYTTYIRAAKEVLNVNDNVMFICVGDGDNERYRQMINKRYEGRIIVLGHEKNIESVMNICDIGVLTTFTEGISNSLLEFMALSKPIVVAGEGGCSELVVHEKNGYLLKSGDYKGVENYITSLLEDVNMKSEFGKASRKIVEEKFSMKRMTNSFIQEYELLINK